ADTETPAADSIKDEEQVAEETTTDSPEKKPKASHGRQPSQSIQSKMRSEAFRGGHGPTSPTALKSPTQVTSPADDVQDIYRKQVQRIEQLEQENKKLVAEARENSDKVKKVQDELEELREAHADGAEIKSKADQAEQFSKQIEELKAEVASLQRQNTQLQSAAKRRVSSNSPSNADSSDLQAQLDSKSSTIESLELEISSLNNQLTSSQNTITSQAMQITALESSVQKAESNASSTSLELADLKQNLARASDRALKEGTSKSSLETRIAQLETEKDASTRRAEEAGKRAETLEKKVETLTTLHREADARTQSRMRETAATEREARDLRTQVARLTDQVVRLKKAGALEGHDDGDDVAELEDEERRKLETQIRELEAENFDLRRGVWRDRRKELQPGMEHAVFDDVDLSPDGMPPGRRSSLMPRGRGGSRAGSTFTDVINSGISAFTGQSVRRLSSAGASQQPRKQSLGLLSDDGDFEFDEDAFRQAQEEEAKKRLERIKEIKRGLKRWEGWRVDLVEIRVAQGGVFDV
ncbi:hypothetical protein P152DRAFT_391352, partial [Eremomyces bilateralis CBS 781.70]